MRRLWLAVLGLGWLLTARAAEPANLEALAAAFPQQGPALRRALAARGCALLDGPGEPSLSGAYADYALHGLPTLVTSDAVLHLWCAARARLRSEVETERLEPWTRELVLALWSARSALTEPAPPSELQTLAVAVRLAGGHALVPPALLAQTEPQLVKSLSEGPPDLRQWLGRLTIPLDTVEGRARARWWEHLLAASAVARSARARIADVGRWLAGSTGPDDARLFALLPAAEPLVDPTVATALAALATDEPGAPAFARTDAWRAKQRQAALATGVRLRARDGGGPGVRDWGYRAQAAPGGWVEPVPTFWRRFGELVRACEEGLTRRQLGSAETRRTLDRLGELATWLEADARLELVGQPPAHADTWAGFAMHLRALPDPDAATVSVPAAERDRVVYAGSGRFHPLVVAFELPGAPPVAAVGAAASYYECAEPVEPRLRVDVWRQRLGSTYARPEPPAWTGVLRLPEPSPATELRALLRAAEAALLDRRPADALARLSALPPTARGTEAEVRAQLLRGRAYLAQQRWVDARAAFAACADLYGCSARDEARREEDDVERRQHWAAREAEQQRVLDAALVLTAPQPGLTPAAERDRQTRRAGALLHDLPYDRADERLQRVLTECPLAGQVPAVRLRRLGLPPRFRDDPEQTVGRSLTALAAVEQDYRDSYCGELAAATLAEALVATEPARALALLDRYVDQRRTVEPYPEALAWLTAGDLYGFHEALPPQPARDALSRLAAPLLLGAAQRGEPGEFDRLWPRLEPLLGSDPTAREARLARRWSLAEPAVWRLWVAAVTGPPRDAAARLTALADAHPRSALAPPALERAAIGGERGRPDAVLVARIARDYPTTAPGLRARARLACAAGDSAGTEPLWRQADELDHDDDGAGRPRRASVHGREEETAREARRRQWLGDLQARRETAACLRSEWPGLGDEAEVFRLLVAVDNGGAEGDLAAAELARRAGADAPRVLARAEAYAWLQVHYPHSETVQAWRALRVGESLAAAVDRGPGADYDAHVLALAQRFGAEQSRYGDACDSLRASCEWLATQRPGSPSAALARAACAEALLEHGWLEQAVEVATPATDYESPFRARAAAAARMARARLADRQQRARELWRKTVGASFEPIVDHHRPAALNRSTVFTATYLPTGRAGLVALARDTGDFRWQAEWPVPLALVATDETLYADDGEGVAALAADTGEVRWRWHGGEATGRDRRLYLALTPDRLLVATGNLLVALDPVGGAVRWRHQTAHGQVGQPLLDGAQVLCREDASYRHPGLLACLALADGAPRWALDLQPYAAHLVGGPLQTPDGSVLCQFRTATYGQREWRRVDTADGRLLPPAAVPWAQVCGPEGRVPWVAGRRIGGLWRSGGGQIWSPDMSDSESRDAVLAHAGGRLWLSLGPELTALAADTLEPVGRRRLSSDAVGLCADARGVFVLTRDGQVVALSGP